MTTFKKTLVKNEYHKLSHTIQRVVARVRVVIDEWRKYATHYKLWDSRRFAGIEKWHKPKIIEVAQRIRMSFVVLLLVFNTVCSSVFVRTISQTLEKNG